MAAPPTDISPAELFAKLLERPRPSEVIDFPRIDATGKPLGRVRIQVLSLEQHDAARMRARAYLQQRRGDGKAVADDTALAAILSDATACELLAMACCAEQPIKGTDDSPRFALLFLGVDQIRAKLTTDELQVLFTSYLLVQRRFGPLEDSIESEEELTAWIRRLAEGASALPLAQLDSFQRAELLGSLSARAYCLSAILESQWPSLPESLRSVLAMWGIGRGLFSVAHATGLPTGTSQSTERADLARSGGAEGAGVVGAADTPVARAAAERPLQLEDAARLAVRLLRGEDPGPETS